MPAQVEVPSSGEHLAVPKSKVSRGWEVDHVNPDSAMTTSCTGTIHQETIDKPVAVAERLAEPV
jgi:hypothetical protein